MGRRYGDFNKLHKKLRIELPGKVLPPMPRKNKQSSTASNLMSGIRGEKDDDASSISSVSTLGTLGTESSLRNLTVKDHRRSASARSLGSSPSRSSVEGRSGGENGLTNSPEAQVTKIEIWSAFVG